MSDLTPQPSMGTPSPAPPPAAASDRSVPWRHWIVLAAVAVVAMLVGAIAATTVTLVLIGNRQLEDAQQQYNVTVSLDLDVTAEQKTAVELALPALHPVNGVQLESREQAWERFKEQFKDQPELVNSVRPESMPESFRLMTTGKGFDCATLTPVRQLPGVDEISVLQLPANGRPGALLDCG